MAYKKTATQLFIDCAKEIYISLPPDEKDNIAYTAFIDKTIEKYSGQESNESSRKTGYKYFKEYYYSHELNKNNKYIKPKNFNLSYDYIQPLLEYDTRRERLLNALGDKYRYSWFFKNVYVEDETKKSRIFLIIESKDEIIENVYEILSTAYTDMFKSMYLGYGGLVLVFYKKESFNQFIEYIKKERK